MNKFTLSQRRLLSDNFKDALVSLDVDGEQYFKRLGSTVQAIMREATHFTCLYKPIEGVVTEKKQKIDGVERITEFVTITIVLYQPGTNDKIVLERTFTKVLLESA